MAFGLVASGLLCLSFVGSEAFGLGLRDLGLEASIILYLGFFGATEFTRSRGASAYSRSHKRLRFGPWSHMAYKDNRSIHSMRVDLIM